MSRPSSLRNLFKHRRNAVLVLVAAVVIWSFVWWQMAQSAPERQHIDAGAQFLAQAKGAEAEREWRKALRLNPQNAETWELLGDYYLAVSNWSAAVDAFGHVEKLRPETPTLQPRLALAAFRSGKFKAAQQHLNIALKQTPKDITTLKVAAAVAETEKKPDEQLKYLRQLVELQPEDPNMMMALATVLELQYQYSEAVSLLDRILQIDPQFVTAYGLRGRAYYQDNPTPERLAKAEADFKKVLQLDPGNVEAHRYLGRIYVKLNRPAQAIHHFEEVGRDRPYASAHLFELSNAYRRVGNIRKAEESLRRFSMLSQVNIQTATLESRIDKNPDDYDSYLRIAQLLFKNVESGEATYHLYRYNYINRNWESVAYYLSKAAKLRPQDARLQSVIQQVERAYERHLQQSSLAMQRRDYERADWHLGRAVLLRPNDERTRQALLRFAPDSQGKSTLTPRPQTTAPQPKLLPSQS